MNRLWNMGSIEELAMLLGHLGENYLELKDNLSAIHSQLQSQSDDAQNSPKNSPKLEDILSRTLKDVLGEKNFEGYERLFRAYKNIIDL